MIDHHLGILKIQFKKLMQISVARTMECWIHLKPISEVKQHLTAVVIGWVTAWEQA